MFRFMFDDDEEDKEIEKAKEKKVFGLVNGMADSILRGIGVGGAAWIVTGKHKSKHTFL